MSTTPYSSTIKQSLRDMWICICKLQEEIGTGTFTPAAANPTAQVGLVPLNGVAVTYMRSDAAPALNQAIIPTWTGLHTFNAGIVASTITDNTLIGTGVRMVTTSAAGVLGSTTLPGTVVNQATSATLTTAQSGTFFTNQGAVANVIYTLPTATVGLVYEFVNVVGGATGHITLTANGAETILKQDGTTATTATSITKMDQCKLICGTAGQWILVNDPTGDWT